MMGLRFKTHTAGLEKHPKLRVSLQESATINEKKNAEHKMRSALKK